MNMKSNSDEKTGRSEVTLESSFAGRCVESCRKVLAQIEHVRSDVVAEFRGRLEEHQHVLELAVNEAEALAWETGFPQLLFPTLAAEKATAVATWHARQHSLRPMAIAA